MTKLEELKDAYGAATPGEWTAPGFNSQGGQVACLLGPDGLRLVSGNFKRPDAKFIALAHNLMPQLLAAAEMVRRARSLIAEAVDVHIYNVENGEVPDPDCRYMAFLNDSKTLLKELK